MVKCPKCGEMSEKDSLFCQNCGYKLNSSDAAFKSDNAVSNVSNSYELGKNRALIVLGYLTVAIMVLAIFGGWSGLKVVNADRAVLYPLLSVMLSFYVSFKLIAYSEATYRHGVIVAAVSFIIFAFGAVVASLF